MTWRNRIRRAATGAVWTPASLFGVGDDGYYIDINASTLYSDELATTAAVVDGPVWWAYDLSGNDHHVSAPNSAARPLLRESGGLRWLEFDGVSSIMYRPNATLVLSAPHTAGAAFSRGETNTNHFFFGVQATANTNDYAQFAGLITARDYSRKRFATTAKAAVLTSTGTNTFPLSTMAVFSRQVALSPGNMIHRNSGGTIHTGTVASNWTGTEVSAASTNIYFGPESATASTGVLAQSGFYINRALSAEELDQLEVYMAESSGVSAW